MSKKKNKPLVIKLGEHLTIDSTPAVYKDLLDALKQRHDIQMESENIIEIDLSGIQLIEHAKKAVSEIGVNLTLKLKFVQNAASLLKGTGFSHLLNN